MSNSFLPDQPTLRTPMDLVQAMLDENKWAWVSAFMDLAPEQVSPDELFRAVLKAGSGGELADRLARQALLMGADPDVSFDLDKGGTASSLGLAAVHGHAITLEHLLTQPQASRWLAAPFGREPLAHALAARSRWTTLRQLKAVGLDMGRATDGSLPWEKVPAPGEYAFMTDPSLNELTALELLPDSLVEIEEAAVRMTKGVNRRDLPRLQAWIGAVTQRLGVGVSPSMERLKTITAWVQMDFPTSGYPAHLRTSVVDAMIASSDRSEFIEPLVLREPKNRAGSWTMAAAAAWALLIEGPVVRPLNIQGGHDPAKRVADFDVWAALDGVDRQHPIWDAPVFSNAGEAVTLRGLGALASAERAFQDATRAPEVNTSPSPIWRYALDARDVQAALSTLVAAAAHLGPERRRAIAPFAHALMTPMLTPVGPPSTRPHGAPVLVWTTVEKLANARSRVDQLRGTLALIRQGVTCDEKRLGPLFVGLEGLAYHDRASFNRSDWLTLRKTIASHPPMLTQHMETTRLLDAGLLGALPASPDPLLQIPLLRPDTPVSQALLKAIEGMSCVTGQPESAQMPQAWYEALIEVHQGSTIEEDEDRVRRPEAPEDTWTPPVDHLNWLISLHLRHSLSQKFSPSIPQGPFGFMWSALKNISDRNEVVPERLAQVLQSSMLSFTFTHSQFMMDEWKRALAIGDQTHPAAWLKSIGIPLSDTWAKKLSSEIKDTDPQARQVQAIQRAYDTPSLEPQSDTQKRQRLRRRT